MITPIDQLRGISAFSSEKPEKTNQNDGVFQSVFQSAIQNVRETDAKKSQAQYLLATGQLDNPSTLMIAATKSQIAVDMLVQLRNRTMEAYTELTRTSL